MEGDILPVSNVLEGSHYCGERNRIGTHILILTAIKTKFNWLYLTAFICDFSRRKFLKVNRLNCKTLALHCNDGICTPVHIMSVCLTVLKRLFSCYVSNHFNDTNLPPSNFLNKIQGKFLEGPRNPITTNYDISFSFKIQWRLPLLSTIILAFREPSMQCKSDLQCSRIFLLVMLVLWGWPFTTISGNVKHLSYLYSCELSVIIYSNNKTKFYIIQIRLLFLFSIKNDRSQKNSTFWKVLFEYFFLFFP